MAQYHSAVCWHWAFTNVTVSQCCLLTLGYHQWHSITVLSVDTGLSPMAQYHSAVCWHWAITNCTVSQCCLLTLGYHQWHSITVLSVDTGLSPMAQYHSAVCWHWAITNYTASQSFVRFILLQIDHIGDAMKQGQNLLPTPISDLREQLESEVSRGSLWDYTAFYMEWVSLLSHFVYRWICCTVVLWLFCRWFCL